jgi:hypothetical protein
MADTRVRWSAIEMLVSQGRGMPEHEKRLSETIHDGARKVPRIDVADCTGDSKARSSRTSWASPAVSY